MKPCYHVIIAFVISTAILVSTAICPVHAESPKQQIGVITSLTGALATIGTAVKNGVQLAREDRPDLFTSLAFSYEDDQFDPKQGLTAYRKLKSANAPPLLILGFGTILAQAIGPLLPRDEVPLINFGFEAAPAVGNPFIVRSLNNTDQYMAALGQYLLKQGDQEIPIVQTESTFFDAMVNSLDRAVGTTRPLRENARVNPGDMDFRTVITKLRTLNKPQIGVFLWPDQLLAFFRQAREMGLKSEIFGTDLCETVASMAVNDTLAEGCFYPDNEVSEDFRKKYKEKYSNEAQLTFAGSAYDMTMLVGDLLKEQKHSDAQQFLTALSLVQQRQGVLGAFSYRAAPSTGKFFEYPVRIKKISNKRGVPVE